MLKLTLPLILIILLPSTLSGLMVLPLLVIYFKYFMFYYNFNFIISNSMLLDSMSSPLIILTVWVTLLMIYASSLSTKNKYQMTLNILIIILCIILVLSFMTSNLIIYYILFEASLLPTLMIILGWGYQPERLQASMYLMMYTITASLPFLIALMMHLKKTNSLFIFILFNNPSLSCLLGLMFIFAFLVKMPMYITHLWLPKAHVEAPVAGSMILAGVLLKLGGYGMVRIMGMVKGLMQVTQSIFISLSMWGAISTAIICIRQQDMKSLIAYSSVGHMALIITAVMPFTKWGVEGAITMMIAHGLASPGLFALANMSYEINKTRSLALAKGALFLMPIMSIWWFLLSIANMAAPPTLNLAGEIMLMISVVYNNSSMAILFGGSSFLAAVYSLILYTAANHGKPMNYTSLFFNSFSRNSFVNMLHITPLYIIILFPYLFIYFS